MKFVSYLIILIVSVFSIPLKAELPTISQGNPVLIDHDSTFSENEALFYRVGENQLIELVYNEIFGQYIGSTVLWLNIFSDNALLNFSNNDFLMLETNRSGGFEIYDEENNYVTVAPDLQNNYSLETNNGIWVKTRENGFNKTYFSNNKGKEYTMTFKISLGGKKTIKDEGGYQITLNGKINGNYDISDNEGRKMKIEIDRSGIYHLIEGDRVIKTMIAQSLQSFRIGDVNNGNLNIRMRGRFNDLIITSAEGQEIFVKNRFKKPLPPVKKEDTN